MATLCCNQWTLEKPEDEKQWEEQSILWITRGTRRFLLPLLWNQQWNNNSPGDESTGIKVLTLQPTILFFTFYLPYCAFYLLQAAFDEVLFKQFWKEKKNNPAPHIHTDAQTHTHPGRAQRKDGKPEERGGIFFHQVGDMHLPRRWKAHSWSIISLKRKRWQKQVGWVKRQRKSFWAVSARSHSAVNGLRTTSEKWTWCSIVNCPPPTANVPNEWPATCLGERERRQDYQAPKKEPKREAAMTQFKEYFKVYTPLSNWWRSCASLTDFLPFYRF